MNDHGVTKVTLTDEERLLRRVDTLMTALLRPTFVYRMATGLLGSEDDFGPLTDPKKASALTRRFNGAREIDEIVRAYVAGQLD